MPQSERVRVLKGDLRKTSGGLVAADLVRNKRGKVVSRKKSSQASGANNLGSWLRSKGDKFGGKPKGFKGEVKPAKPAPKPEKVAKKPAKVEPMKAGEKKDLAEISVGNIIPEYLKKLEKVKKRKMRSLKTMGFSTAGIKKRVDAWWKQEIEKHEKQRK